MKICLYSSQVCLINCAIHWEFMTFCCFFSDYCIICIIYLRWMCRQKATLFCTISIKISFFENLFIGFHVDGLKSGRKYAVQLLFESEILSFLFYFTFLCFLIYLFFMLAMSEFTRANGYNRKRLIAFSFESFSFLCERCGSPTLRNIQR